MLDRDLAELYRVETRVLNQAVTRNADRFPNDFMFPLSRDEIERISQIVTSSKIKFSKNVRAFSEQVAAQIPWFHNCTIMGKVKESTQREWYIIGQAKRMRFSQ